MMDRPAIATVPETLNGRTIQEFKASVQGVVLRPGDDGYEEARRVWNGMIDRRPALIMRCTGAADVIAAVKFARAHGLVVAVRGGGHNVAGTAGCLRFGDDGRDCHSHRHCRAHPRRWHRLADAQARAHL